MKSILAITALFAMLSLCNLSEKMKPAANSTPANTNSNERRSTTAENDPAADREAVKAELMKLENEVTTASFNGDISVLARNMAENYVGTSADGTTQTKNQILAATKPDKATKFWTITDAQLVSFSGDS
ncbi:MAG: nuclear transport factor 2 family protein, partial [Pyrinomonadaceae bacterium]